MHKRPLGSSPIKVTPIILRVPEIAHPSRKTHEKEVIETIQVSIDQGVSTIDTAAVYGMGLSEEIVGKAIKGQRDKVVIATKCGLRWDTTEGSDPHPSHDLKGNPIVLRKNSKPQSIMYECEQSLKRLGVHVIDLYQIHGPDTSTLLEESWGAMVRLLEQGKVRAIGVCNYSLEQLSEIHAIYPVHSIQSPYSLISRDPAQNLLPFCENNNIGFLTDSFLEGGLLIEKITKKNNSCLEHVFSENKELMVTALSTIQGIAERHKATPLQIIIHCTYHMPWVTAVLVGAHNELQARENAKATALHLSKEEQFKVIDALFAVF